MSRNSLSIHLLLRQHHILPAIRLNSHCQKERGNRIWGNGWATKIVTRRNVPLNIGSLMRRLFCANLPMVKYMPVDCAASAGIVSSVCADNQLVFANTAIGIALVERSPGRRNLGKPLRPHTAGGCAINGLSTSIAGTLLVRSGTCPQACDRSWCFFLDGSEVRRHSLDTPFCEGWTTRTLHQGNSPCHAGCV